MSEQSNEEYWEQVQDIGQLKLGEATTVRFQRGVTKRDKREVISFRLGLRESGTADPRSRDSTWT